jgi:nucleolar protein 14
LPLSCLPRISLLAVVLDGIEQWSRLYQDEVAFPEMFSPLYSLILGLEKNPSPLSNLPEGLRSRITTLSDYLRTRMTAIYGDRRSLCLQLHRAIPLKTFEPRFEESYSLDRKSKKSRSSSRDELCKLRHVHKREFKGALRELRRDTQFLARHHLEKQLEHHRDYQDRIREITHDLEQQQAEANALRRRRAS